MALRSATLSPTLLKLATGLELQIQGPQHQIMTMKGTQFKDVINQLSINVIIERMWLV